MIFQNNFANLLDLIGFGFTSLPLYVDFFHQPFFSIEVMTSTNSLLEAQVKQ